MDWTTKIVLSALIKVKQRRINFQAYSQCQKIK
jgi:hypothetical protein